MDDAARYLANPYPYYSRLRATDPVHWNAAMQFWTLTRYSDVLAALMHPALSSRRLEPNLDRLDEESKETGRHVYGALSKWLLRSDPPEHTRLRALATPALQGGAVPRLRGRIEQAADGLLDAVTPAHQMELISEFAAPLALSSIAGLIGVPPADHARFHRWSSDVGAAAETGPNPRLLVRAQASLLEVKEYLQGLIAQRRSQPADDLLSAWLRPAADGSRLTGEEIVDLCALLLLAGHDTATHLLANGVLALLQHPDQLDLLRAEPVLLDHAVQEILRFDSPLQGLLRVAREDLELGGKRIRRDHTVLIWLAAANRDPGQFAQPDRLDIVRKGNRHLGFGHGMHHCLGASLGLLTVGVGIERLLKRTPGLRLADVRVEWQGNFLFRSQRSMRILF
jgi:cytochrome P450